MCKDTEPRALPEDSDSPKWFDGKKVIEIAFCEEFLTRHPMCCIHGRFFTADGPIPDDVVRRLIYEELKAHAVSGVGKAVATLLDVLRMECYSPGLPLQTDRIHVANGTLFLDGRLEPAKEFCLNRLPVEYHPDAPEPKTWLMFVEELLYNEDIPTLQEYIRAVIVPEMQRKLRQGFGRAIRTETDTCVVSILDKRAAPDGRYHEAVREALPKTRLSDNLEDVKAFIRAKKGPDYFLP